MINVELDYLRRRAYDRTTVTLWHPDSPGVRVKIRPSLLRRMRVVRSPFATLGETLRMYRDMKCKRVPRGWWCSCWAGHDGPCPARPRWWNLRSGLRFGWR